eukprot:4802670-Pleurochrysis_carterae.AAC.1
MAARRGSTGLRAQPLVREAPRPKRTQHVHMRASILAYGTADTTLRVHSHMRVTAHLHIHTRMRARAQTHTNGVRLRLRMHALKRAHSNA